VTFGPWRGIAIWLLFPLRLVWPKHWEAYGGLGLGPGPSLLPPWASRLTSYLEREYCQDEKVKMAKFA